MSLYDVVVLLFMKHQKHDDSRGRRGLAPYTHKPGNAWARQTSFTVHRIRGLVGQKARLDVLEGRKVSALLGIEGWVL